MLEIQHHGIMGQKWGVRNGPPYPLDYNDHSAAEKRAMKKEGKSIQKRLNENDALIANMKFTREKAKQDNRSEDYADAQKQISRAMRNGKKLVDEALKKGYAIDSRAITREAYNGASKTAALIRAGFLAPWLGYASGNIRPRAGTQYKVLVGDNVKFLKQK